MGTHRPFPAVIIHSQMDLLRAFRAHLRTLPIPRGRALVAVSGGPDSVALLDLMVRASPDHELDLVVAHFDHGIHPESARIAGCVGDMAAALDLPLERGRGRLGPAAGETAAREARHAFLEEARRRLDAATIFLGHHADDQVETVLLRLLAGSGPAGLAGIAAVNGPLVRPLLPFTRSDLARYVRIRALPVWLDPANDDLRHQRAWVRARLLPMLRERAPDVDAALLRAASQARADRTAWDALLDLVPGLDPRLEHDGISVAGVGLRGYDSALVTSLVLALARRVNCPLGPRRATRVLALLESGSSGSEAPLSAGWKAEVAFGRLRLVRAGSRDVSRERLRIAGEQGQGSWGSWNIVWRRDVAPEHQERVELTAWFTPDALTVRGWTAGDRMRPLAGAGRRLVVRCFQDARVPKSRRESWPVIAGPDEVVWVPGVCRSDALVPPAGSEALRVDAELV
jgi:tRNA(Ile)-lysidine synthase